MIRSFVENFSDLIISMHYEKGIDLFKCYMDFFYKKNAIMITSYG